MERLSTGIPPLDLILDGGLPAHSLTVVAGAPGTGKTVLSQQLVFANARPDAPALYLTTLSEPAAKLLRYLQRFSFYDEGKLLDAKPSIYYRDIAEPVRQGGFAALPSALGAMLAEYRPAVLVIDSFKALRDLGLGAADVRRALFEVASSLAARACTTMLVGEYTPAEIEQLPEFAIADGVIQLVNKPYGTRDERYLRVLKLRGSGYRAGEHAFRIDAHGLVVFPRLVTPSAPTAYTADATRISTGVAGLDTMFGGGVRRGSSTLLVGPAGGGKTLLGLHFLFAGAARGEEGLLVNFQENPSMLRYVAGALGWPPTELDPGGKLTSLYLSPVELNVDDVVQRILAVLEERPIRRVVIDSLGDLFHATADSERFRSYVYSLMQLFTVRGITGYVLNESSVDPAFSSFTPVGASYISDNVIVLRRDVTGPASAQELGRTLTVVKCRGGGHDQRIRPMVIDAHGVRVEVGGARG